MALALTSNAWKPDHMDGSNSAVHQRSPVWVCRIAALVSPASPTTLSTAQPTLRGRSKAIAAPGAEVANRHAAHRERIARLITTSSSQTSHDGSRPQPPARFGGLFRRQDDGIATTESLSGELCGRQEHTRAPRIAGIHDLGQRSERRSDTLPRFSKEALQQVPGASIGAPALFRSRTVATGAIDSMSASPIGLINRRGPM